MVYTSAGQGSSSHPGPNPGTTLLQHTVSQLEKLVNELHPASQSGTQGPSVQAHPGSSMDGGPSKDILFHTGYEPTSFSMGELLGHSVREVSLEESWFLPFCRQLPCIF